MSVAAAERLVIAPETVELRVGASLQLRLQGVDVYGEVAWYLDGAPLPQHVGAVCSIPAVQERHQGTYHAVVQRGPFGGAAYNIPASVLISEPAFVFVVPQGKMEENAEPVTCAICMSAIEPRECYRFRRKTEESFHSGFRVLSAEGRFSDELLFCTHDFHRACVAAYAEHAIVNDGKWHVRCPSQGCAYRLYTSDIRELCGEGSKAFTSYCQLKTQDHSERMRQVQAGEEVDAETRQWMAANCDVCPGCHAIVFKDAGCRTITCPCETRFVHGEHRKLSS